MEYVLFSVIELFWGDNFLYLGDDFVIMVMKVICIEFLFLRNVDI